jgi:hypothetical protein
MNLASSASCVEAAQKGLGDGRYLTARPEGLRPPERSLNVDWPGHTQLGNHLKKIVVPNHVVDELITP